MKNRITRIKALFIAVLVVVIGIALVSWRIAPQQSGLYGIQLENLIVSPDGKYIAIRYMEDLTSVPGKGISAGDMRFNETIEIRDFATGSLEHRFRYTNIRGIGDIAFDKHSRSLLISKREKTGFLFFGHPTGKCYRLDLGSGNVREALADVTHFWLNQRENTLWTDVGGPCMKDEDVGPAYLVQRDVRTGKELRRLAPILGHISSISPDGKIAVTNHYHHLLDASRRGIGYKDVSLQVYDLVSGRQITTLEGKSDFPSYALAFSLDGTMFAASEQYEGIAQKTMPIRIWNVSTGKLICTLSGGTCNFKEILFSRDRKKLIAMDSDGHLIRWDIAKKKADWQCAGKDLTGIAFSPDGSKIVVGSTPNIGTSYNPKWVPGALTILDAQTGNPVKTINP